MRLNDFEITHSVELEVLHDGRKTTLLTSVEGIIDNHVLLTPIHLNGKIVGFPPKFTVNLLYPEEGHVYYWNDVTVKAARYHGKIYHYVELFGEAAVSNRRGAYRVFIGESRYIFYRTNSDTKMFEIFLRDLSETGMCFMSKNDFEIGRALHLQLHRANGAELTLRAKILWRRENPNRNTTFLYGCKFTEKNKILNRYLMSLQQAKQKKRMGLD